jgi:hypothetical protein
MRGGLHIAGLTLTAVTLIGVLTVGVAVAAQPAGTTWTVKPGGAIKGKAGTTQLTDTTSGLTLSCVTSKLNGTLKSGKGLRGSGIGTVTSMDFNNCTVNGFTVSVSSGTVAWPLNATSFNPDKGMAKGTITKIHLSVSSDGCRFVVDGTSSTANDGAIEVSYTNKTAALKMLSNGSRLHVWDVKGCLGAIHDGDAGYISGSYRIKPAQTITAAST